MNILSSLNPKQKEAVAVIRGPVLVIAGPGSGKTRCLTYRITYLIQKDIYPENILAVTFTNKAASEMKERVWKLLQENKTETTSFRTPLIGTFHSICLRILRQDIDKLSGAEKGDKHKKNFIIYDTTDQLSLIKQAIKNSC